MPFSIEKDGFEIISSLLGENLILSIREELEQSSKRRTRAGLRSALRIPGIRALAEDKELVNLAAAVLDKRATPFRATLFDKSSHSNWLVVWHQDTALPVRERRNVAGWGPWSVKDGTICANAPPSALEKVLAIRLHLDPSEAENGPLKVLPCTHKLGVLTGDQIHDLTAAIPAVECHVPEGGALLMRPLIVHSSSKAKAVNTRRRVLHIEYTSDLYFPGGIELDQC